jgi:hypothetical protein
VIRRTEPGNMLTAGKRLDLIHAQLLLPRGAAQNEKTLREQLVGGTTVSRS